MNGEDLGTIDADDGRLEALFENLFRNAIEHGGENVTVRVGRSPTEFYVEDDGPGIPEDEREQVFDHGHTTSESGTGFGLSIVEQIADAHGWDVVISEGADSGARFEVHL
jgi:signal transduction histidine kinase